MQFLSLGSGGLNFVMNCVNVYVNATDLTLYGNEGYFGGNVNVYVNATDLTLYGNEGYFGGNVNVSVRATDLTLYGNEGYFGGNMYLYFLLFTNISFTLENGYLGAGKGSRGAGTLVIIDQDVAVNDKYSYGDHSRKFLNTCYYRSRRGCQ